MKKFITTLMAALMVAIVSVNLTSCTESSAQAKLQAEVEKFNKTEAPMNCGNGVTMTACTLDDAGKMLIFKFTFIEPGVTVDDLKPAMSEFKTAMAKELGTDKDGQEMLSLLSEAGYGMKFEIKGKRTGHTVEATITAAEVQKMKK